MVNFVSNFIGSLAILSASVYVWCKLYGKSLDFKNTKLYLVCSISIVLIILNYFYVNVFFRILCVCIIFFVTNKLLFRENNNKTVISTVLSEFLICFSDLLFGILVLYVLKIDLERVPEFYGTLFANIFVFVMCVGVANMKFLKKFYSLLMIFINRVKKRKIILFSLLSIISLNFLLALIYFKLNTYYLLIINTVMILIYSYVIIKNFETSSNNEIISAKNSFLMSNLHQYEDMVDRQRIDNHENKNQLLIIKNMIDKNDKNVVKYIDTVIKDKKEDDEVLYTRVKTIPSGGLQGIIYQKMLVMKDENILFSLDVSRDVRKVDMDSLCMEDNYRLCKIIGVFLDNAIEESRNIDNNCIMISLYVDDEKLIIDISNRCSGNIELNRIADGGYSTKGNGHGYGLSLVKKILSETDCFINETSVKKNIFKQVIKVKIKNT